MWQGFQYDSNKWAEAMAMWQHQCFSGRSKQGYVITTHSILCVRMQCSNAMCMLCAGLLCAGLLCAGLFYVLEYCVCITHCLT
jgi:hypothetical protein